jgi:hypothetical protein
VFSRFVSLEQFSVFEGAEGVLQATQERGADSLLVRIGFGLHRKRQANHILGSEEFVY